MAALSRADALVFVVNGASELTDSELIFLERANKRVSTVVFVLTQIDKYPQWRQTVERNRELLHTRTPRLADAPWFTVSSRYKSDADQAAATGQSERAAQLLERSGFGPFTEDLRTRVITRVAALRLLGVVRVAGEAIGRLGYAEQELLAALGRDPHLEQKINEQLAALQKSDHARWRQQLLARFDELDQQLQRTFTRRAQDLRNTAVEQIAAGEGDVFLDVVGDFQAGMEGLWMDLETTMRREVARIVAALADEFNTHGVDVLMDQVPFPDRIDQLPLARSGQQETSLGDLLELVALPAAGVASLGGAALGPLGFAAGLGVGWFVGQRRKARQQELTDKADANLFITLALEEMRNEMLPTLRQAMKGTIPSLIETATARLEDRRRQLEAALAEHRRSLQAREAELAPKRAPAQRRLERLKALSKAAASLDAQLALAR